MRKSSFIHSITDNSRDLFCRLFFSLLERDVTRDCENFGCDSMAIVIGSNMRCDVSDEKHVSTKLQDATARRLKYLTRVCYFDVLKFVNAFRCCASSQLFSESATFSAKVRKCASALCVLIFILLHQLSGKLNSFYRVADSQWCMTKVVDKKMFSFAYQWLTAEPNALQSHSN